MPSLGIAPRPGGCIGRERNADARRGAGFRRLSGGWIFASSGDWDSGSLAFTVSHESRDALLRTPGHSRRFPGMLFSPLPFRTRVSHPIPRHLLSSLPATRAIQRCALVAPATTVTRPHRTLGQGGRPSPRTTNSPTLRRNKPRSTRSNDATASAGSLHEYQQVA